MCAMMNFHDFVKFEIVVRHFSVDFQSAEFLVIAEKIVGC